MSKYRPYAKPKSIGRPLKSPLCNGSVATLPVAGRPASTGTLRLRLEPGETALIHRDGVPVARVTHATKWGREQLLIEPMQGVTITREQRNSA